NLGVVKRRPLRTIGHSFARRPMSLSPNQLQPRIRITTHPPERPSGVVPITLACGGCTCTCCCCLHTVGGVIGGIAGSLRPIQQTPRRILDPNFPFPFRRDEEELIDTGLSPTLLYWLLLSFLVAVT